MSLPPDLILYIVIAIVLVFWLRNILGTRHGEERQRPNPFTAPPQSDEKPAAPLDGSAPPVLVGPQGKMLDIPGGPLTPPPIKLPPHTTMDDALIPQITAAQAIDRSFDIGLFARSAQDAYAIILESYAQGDIDELDELTTPATLNQFKSLIAARTKQGHTLTMEVHAIRACIIKEISLQKTTASIALIFTADAMVAEHDANGKLLSGHSEKTAELVDEWVFTRDLAKRDPVWRLSEIRDALGE